MKNILDFTKELMLMHFHDGDVLVDFTMGNGNDTLFLHQQFPESMLIAFDIQEIALENTKLLLQENHANMEKITLINDSHSNLDCYIHSVIDGGIFNLGYLPSCNKQITTLAETTIQAIQKAINLLKIGGLLIIVVYQGHKNGAIESNIVFDYCVNLDNRKFTVLQYNFVNKKAPPYILAIQKDK
ncbi:class I SAM-dependent methyltransferase [Paludicola sp. MB14-C6]|uniref:tRNA (mnm(5)s(2)U34)-methyltransferase n=1 Tax=Paludihabitans sp. MB14-C6 TaxID=3070656 RepID=UPI0027DCE828|nr:class I SAM-dependent methyltransferase [Paludicola sp. MB14-C6]WMJ21917.1 class I SAM-dependent methyltransferase [Paludicola sp. MB14-C6]